MLAYCINVPSSGPRSQTSTRRTSYTGLLAFCSSYSRPEGKGEHRQARITCGYPVGVKFTRWFNWITSRWCRCLDSWKRTVTPSEIDPMVNHIPPCSSFSWHYFLTNYCLIVPSHLCLFLTFFSRDFFSLTIVSGFPQHNSPRNNIKDTIIPNAITIAAVPTWLRFRGSLILNLDRGSKGGGSSTLLNSFSRIPVFWSHIMGPWNRS